MLNPDELSIWAITGEGWGRMLGWWYEGKKKRGYVFEEEFSRLPVSSSAVSPSS